MGYCITLATLPLARTATIPGTHPCPHSRGPTYACQSGDRGPGHGEMARGNRRKSDTTIHCKNAKVTQSYIIDQRKRPPSSVMNDDERSLLVAPWRARDHPASSHLHLTIVPSASHSRFICISLSSLHFAGRTRPRLAKKSSSVRGINIKTLPVHFGTTNRMADHCGRTTF